MIKPEILEMVEVCKRKDSNCIICPHKQLCDDFEKLIKGESVCQTVKYGIEKLISFLTSQEVCEWIRIGKEKYHTGCSKGTDITLMQIDLNMIYCPQCGKKIKEVSM